jgi:hypothetical protein
VRGSAPTTRQAAGAAYQAPAHEGVEVLPDGVGVQPGDLDQGPQGERLGLVAEVPEDRPAGRGERRMTGAGAWAER